MQNTIPGVVKADMVQALKDGDRITASALQSLLARISSAEAVDPGLHSGVGVGSTDVPRKQLSAGDIEQVLKDEIEEIDMVLDQLDSGSEYAKELQYKASALRRYLS